MWIPTPLGINREQAMIICRFEDREIWEVVFFIPHHHRIYMPFDNVEQSLYIYINTPACLETCRGRAGLEPEMSLDKLR